MTAARGLARVIVLGALAAGVTVASRAATRGGRRPTGVMSPLDEDGIKELMSSYNAALNSGRTADVLPLYTEDGVFMAPYSKSHIGIEAVRAAYDAVFQELAFNVRFTIRELLLMSPNYACVRTGSAGTTRHTSTGTTTAEANQELFVLRKDRRKPWRIARYSFSPTEPPPQVLKARQE